jgi:hypothetical protein
VAARFTAALQDLPGTPAGRAVIAAPPGLDPDRATAALTGPDRDRAKRVLALRDQIGLLMPQFQKSVASLTKWQQEFVKAEQGLPATALPKADQKRLEDTAQGQYDTLVGLLDDLRTAAADLGPGARTDFAAGIKKIQADYDAVLARLKKTPPGKILQTITYPVDVDRATAKLTGPDADQARRLLSLVSHYTTLAPKAVPEIGTWEKRKIAADNVAARFQAGLLTKADHGTAQADLKDSERVLTTYVETLGGIVHDLTTLAAEFEAAASPEGQFKKVMAEYDALVLRLARHPVGRLLAVAARNWDQNDIDQLVDLDDAGKKTAGRLLRLRHQLLAEKDRAEELVRNIANNRLLAAKDPVQRADDEPIRSMETGLRVSTEAARGLLAELTKLADELDPLAKKADAPAEDPRFQKLRELKAKLNEIENYQKAIVDSTAALAADEKKVKDLEAQRKGTTDPKAAADLDRKLADGRRNIAEWNDRLAELRAGQAKLPAAEPLQKELDQLRKEIADSLEKKAPKN